MNKLKTANVGKLVVYICQVFNVSATICHHCDILVILPYDILVCYNGGCSRSETRMSVTKLNKPIYL